MTPQHRLAIEIMYQELGMSPHEIVANGDWLEPPTLESVEKVIEPFRKNTRFNPEAQVSLRRNAVSRFLVFEGQRKTLAEWAVVARISRQTLHSRLRRGWSVERALSEIPKERA